MDKMQLVLLRRVVLETAEDMEALAAKLDTDTGDQMARMYKAGQKDALEQWAATLRKRLERAEKEAVATVKEKETGC